MTSQINYQFQVCVGIKTSGLMYDNDCRTFTAKASTMGIGLSWPKAITVTNESTGNSRVFWCITRKVVSGDLIYQEYKTLDSNDNFTLRVYND